MPNPEKLKKEVEYLCTILNRYGYKRQNQFNWSAGPHPKSTFGGGICSDIEAFQFLKKNGYIHDKMCWKCGNDTPHSNHSFTNTMVSEKITYNICNDCFNKGRNFQKNMRNEDETSSNCYIATVCYGDINSIEVEEFRKFRDNTLSKNYFGKLFIKYYYIYSPSIAKALKNKKNTNTIIRNFILNPILKTIKK